jgi:tetrahydromethanopterin S-methyltransferase subunit E
MNRKNVYLILCIAGIAFPYSQFVPWVVENGLHLSFFMEQLFANRVGAFFGMDVFVSAMALLVFARAESTLVGSRARWITLLAVLTVGVSLGLPLLLYMRERKLELMPQTPALR